MFDVHQFHFRSNWPLAAGGGTYMKLQVVVTVKGLNVEHRTSNIEHRMMMTLRFIDSKLNGIEF